jgi:hypothetical protein
MQQLNVAPTVMVQPATPAAPVITVQPAAPAAPVINVEPAPVAIEPDHRARRLRETRPGDLIDGAFNSRRRSGEGREVLSVGDRVFNQLIEQIDRTSSPARSMRSVPGPSG